MPIFDLIVIKHFTSIIQKIKNDIEILFPDLKNDDLLEWQDNFDKLESALNKLKTKQKTEVVSNETLQKDINDIVDRLQKVIYELEILFPTKKITINNEEKNQNNSLSIDEDRTLNKDKLSSPQTSEQLIKNLNLSKIESITKEDGYFREFIKSTDEKGNSFTEIFYLLQKGEKSFFHRLDTEETWTWLRGKPLSLFVLQDNQLIEHVLDKQGQSITIPSQRWFGAILKEDLDHSSTDKHESAAGNIPFSLVSCTCTPAFIPAHFDNNMNEEMVNVYQNASKEHQGWILALLAPEQRIKLNEQVEQVTLKEEEKEKKVLNPFSDNQQLPIFKTKQRQQI